ncbi:hypothetical protein IWQ47_003931 [Aquimarina sp. EL_43]|uniref:DUF4268 domain-containing protein n=1 Tax=unclassified Aquimarina TaxID=2627091 RepID=UPI0018CAADF3|nr:MULTISPECIES: DUF4268 domain-containing protein [unclassified Aquimarina]MBG6132707.1 hypothetical protein [Aquimarina sp. EL_35]MBG6152837.1 hypothetical protein [Aquimarina sp. EL_32]MBG6170844.1 hypothetical protein [Aquimarina sp. EL_43]
MFSKSESKQIRQEFWTSFGKEYPRKWVLYNTKIKDVTLKFTFTTKKAQVSIDIEPYDKIIKAYYYDKFISLKKILTSEFIEDIIYNEFYELDSGKVISRIYVEIDNVSIHNRNTWSETMVFLSKNMDKLEEFFLEYKEYISD